MNAEHNDGAQDAEDEGADVDDQEKVVHDQASGTRHVYTSHSFLTLEKQIHKSNFTFQHFLSVSIPPLFLKAVS